MYPVRMWLPVAVVSLGVLIVPLWTVDASACCRTVSEALPPGSGSCCHVAPATDAGAGRACGCPGCGCETKPDGARPESVEPAERMRVSGDSQPAAPSGAPGSGPRNPRRCLSRSAWAARVDSALEHCVALGKLQR